MDVGGYRASVGGRRRPLSGKSYFLGGIAVLAVSGIIGGASPAEAATSIFWPDYYQPAPLPRIAPLRVRKSTKHRALPSEDVAKDARKPQGPLIIAISIDRQVLKIYDANGYFAETPISTGMRGHSTPMGVFSVIQKHKYHRSNIYSGAPMPYMQRITWSGVAMHAGVLPGYPASHGCIRMPMNFAVKMWGWTRMGARVVIAPGELTPENFSHPLLAAQKVAPAPAAAAEPKNDVAVTAKSDKAVIAEASIKRAFSESSLELKSTVGHDLANPAAGEAAVAATLREQTHTADASSVLSQPTISDATSSAPHPTAKVDGDTAKASDAPAGETKAETAEAASKSVEAAVSDDDANIKSVETTAADVKPAEIDASGKTDVKSASVEVQSPAQPADEPVKNELPASESVKADNGASDAAKVETAEAADVKADIPTSDVSKAMDKAEEQVKPAADAGAVIPEVKKDQTRASDPDKAAAPKLEPAAAAAPKRTGQIAVFVSRKDGKLYVRQNFAPLFDIPVTVAPSERPLGTHVFTAQTDKDDANLLHWSVVSMPVVARYAARQDDDERASRRRKTTGAIEVKPAPVPDSAAEALDRLTIPVEAMARIAEALSTGGSIIVSDQGITAGETGEGTDFIVPLR
jgi:L,D-transpeptidase catalytic domain